MKIKNRFFFGFSLLLILPLGYFIFDRIEFVRTAQQTFGTVEQVMGRNESCGRKRSRHACTKFTATLRYEIQGSRYRIDVTAGSSRGHNKPISHASYAIGEHEQVVYDPRRPARAYRDRTWDIWGAPLMTFLLQVGTFFASLNERRKGGRY